MSLKQGLPTIKEEELLEILDERPHFGISWPRLFGQGDTYESLNWEIRTAKIIKANGEIVFEQKDIEVPDFWSQTALDIVASKYFRGKLGTAQRETSIRQMVNRVADTISGWGLKDGYFQSYADFENFRNDLKFLLVNQYFSFNSPVWFNVGAKERPQASACFILSVEDDMQSIIDWYRDEAWIFKGGSGAGVDLSKLRSSKEQLSKGGYSSGPVSFMKGADGIANSIRSGGETRRAAKMVVLNAAHPDIKDFIYSKKIIEDMTKVLETSGIKASVEADIFNPYTLLPYQNANNSVRATEEFMKTVENDEDWQLRAVTTGEVLETVKANQIMNWIADAAWHSADPGMQFDTTINDWHTLTNTGRINASNPCSEYMSIDNSSCNLGSINLLKYLRADGSFDIEFYKKTINTAITAQEIIVGNSSYPTEKITRNAIDYRQLGLGYANLGALLMSMGLPYDSEEGRAIAAAISSILCGQAYLMSAEIAKIKGPFAGYEKNREPMLRVMAKHHQAAQELAVKFNSIFPETLPVARQEETANGKSNGLSDTDLIARKATWRRPLIEQAVSVWKQALELGQVYGYRNSQATVIAPTGTIAFMMDCATTGIEPALALVQYKKLVGGGTLKLVNNQVPAALTRLGYSHEQIEEISKYILEKGMIEGAPGIKDKHLPIFDCSFKTPDGKRSINYMGHIKMMSAVQPFVSGAISKTVNLPSEATIDDIRDAFIQAWKLGLKAIAVYRDGSKTVQPLNTSDKDKLTSLLVERTSRYTRVKLPDERPSVTHKFTLGNHEGYLTIGLYPDTNQPGETFITIAKEGSTISGLFDVIATLTSMCLQSGIPLKTLVKKFKDYRFEPAGVTSNSQIPFAKSFMDYIFRYLGYKFLSNTDKEEIFGHVIDSPIPIANGNGGAPEQEVVAETTSIQTESSASQETSTDAPVCECGSIMFRAGSCYVCPNCFATTGVCN